MAHAEELCQHVVMIHQGRKVLDEPMAGLRRQFDPRTIRFEPLDRRRRPVAAAALPGVERVDAAGEGYTVLLCRGHRSGRGHRAARCRSPAGAHRAGAAAARRRVHPPRLEWRPGSEAERALRADLQAPGAEGAVGMKKSRGSSRSASSWQR